MRKMIFIFALFFVLAAGCSCHKTTGEPFKVFEGEFTVCVDAVCEEIPCSFEYDKKANALRFTAPSELAGYVLRLDGDKVIISYDGVQVEISKYAGRLIIICEEIFSSNGDKITSISAQNTDSGTKTAVKTEAFEYYFSSDGTPLSVSGYYGGAKFEFTLSDFKVAEGK